MNHSEFFIYIIKAGLLLLVFWTLYKAILSKETFFKHNRWYLMAGVLVSGLLPLWIIERTEIITVPLTRLEASGGGAQSVTTVSDLNTFAQIMSMDNLLFYIYMAGVLFFSVKLIIQLASLFRILYKGERRHLKGMCIVYSKETTSPFSFFNYIVLPEEQGDIEEQQAIMAHEFVHARQGHSFDILLMHLLTILMWMNPVAWFYRRDAAQNLEYLADKGASSKASSTKNYQYILLRQHLNTHQLSIINPFINSLIKKRIVMLQQRPSNQFKLWKLSLVIPALIAFVLLFNVKTVAQYQFMAVDEGAGSLRLHNSNAQEHLDFMIHKEMDDEQLKALKQEVEQQGGKLKWKKLKRNMAGLITNIEIEFSHESSTASANYSNSDGIETISFGTRSDKGVYIQAGNDVHSDHEMIWIEKDKEKHVNKEVIVISGDSVSMNELGKKEMKVIIKGDNDGEAVWISKDGENVQVNGEKEMKFIIKSGDDKNIWISDEDVDTEKEMIFIKKLHQDSTGADGKKVKKIVVELSEADGEVIHLKGDSTHHKKIVVRELGAVKGDKNIHVISTDGEKPLMIVDGKETEKDVLKDMDPDQIDKIEVLKGEKAIEKYGEKGKNGAMLITTKKQ
ncbi:M56 family peptidase [Robertkochia marina]|uniref:M56 family peptidase n=1 Tax=Robertkochia marina TaxID=1227945 RepID=A0A4S3LY82_9FLAO|nr:M56 family metallopeptidase [Robertkochia marina]THD66538.1 M56 family peptidase [Robertkochia marina]TRZ45621.1 M56 family peptidase [Robertkochia marina]